MQPRSLRTLRRYAESGEHVGPEGLLIQHPPHAIDENAVRRPHQPWTPGVVADSHDSLLDQIEPDYGADSVSGGETSD
jgi:hypothetical protein